jgi:hypothetical protein
MLMTFVRKTQQNKQRRNEMTVGILALIGGLTYTLTTFFKRLLPANLNGWQTQLMGFVVGEAVVFLAAAATITSSFQFNGTALSDLDFWSKVLVGLLGTALFAVVPADLMKSIDNTRSGAITSETKSTDA